MCGKGDLHQEVRESLWNGIWESENEAQMALMSLCVWFVVIYMRAESGTATLWVFSPRRTKPGGWDGASCGCHMLWTHSLGLFGSCFPKQLSEAKDGRAAAPQLLQGFQFCSKSSFSLEKKSYLFLFVYTISSSPLLGPLPAIPAPTHWAHTCHSGLTRLMVSGQAVLACFPVVLVLVTPCQHWEPRGILPCDCAQHKCASCH